MYEKHIYWCENIPLNDFLIRCDCRVRFVDYEAPVEEEERIAVAQRAFVKRIFDAFPTLAEECLIVLRDVAELAIPADASKVWIKSDRAVHVRYRAFINRVALQLRDVDGNTVSHQLLRKLINDRRKRHARRLLPALVRDLGGAAFVEVQNDMGETAVSLLDFQIRDAEYYAKCARDRVAAEEQWEWDYDVWDWREREQYVQKRKEAEKKTRDVRGYRKVLRDFLSLLELVEEENRSRAQIYSP